MNELMIGNIQLVLVWWTFGNIMFSVFIFLWNRRIKKYIDESIEEMRKLAEEDENITQIGE